MKTKIFTFMMIAMLLTAGSIFAQTPQGINYQAVVRNGSGVIVANGTANFRFTFHEGSGGGTVRYKETFSVTTDAYGMANVVLGTGVPVQGSFSAVDWTKTNYLQTELDLTGSYVALGSTKFQSVPYALNAGGGGWTTSGNNLHNSNSGNVGIGNASPTYKLDVNGSLKATNYGWGGNVNWNMLDDNAEYSFDFVNGSGNAYWHVWDPTHGPILVVRNSGNVGVGTDSPTSKLHVAGGDPGLKISNTANGTEISLLPPGNGYTGGLGTGGNYALPLFTNGVDRITIQGDGFIRMCTSADNSSGNIGIGPDLWSNVKVNINSGQDWALAVDGVAGKTGGGSWAGTSDRRLKQNIAPYADGLAALLKINPVTYHYNELSGYDTQKEYVGVIAQELQPIAPYMVFSAPFKDSGNEYLHVDNSAMTYMLINAVKEQQAQIDALKAEIAALKH
jgi:hypothetical protein